MGTINQLEPEQVDALALIIDEADWQTDFYLKYGDKLDDGLPLGYQPYFRKVMRLGLLLRNLNFSAQAIQFMTDHWEEALGLSGIELDALLKLENIQHLLSYHHWIGLDPEAATDYLYPMLELLQSNPAEEFENAFAYYFGFSKMQTPLLLSCHF